ncbi:transposase [Ureibacillus sp. Re31]|uniref:Transposase n=1 Tax=Ureibacillus galli TaxID=2762222 RepID=A0ABR8X8S5_9BACL|nr:transposase [Ureibacillus galli]MBD8025582.1 transposase [Ureibacillus galli]
MEPVMKRMREMVFKNYDEKFKKNIVNLFKNGHSVGVLCKEYKISKATVYSWIRKYSLDANEINHVDIQQENLKLKKEVEVLKQALTIMAAK